MNHVFHKLANDAWIDVPEGQGYGGKIFSKEKFAELIVRECMSLCTDVEEDVELADYVGGFRDGALMCREDIKKHFGVEE